MSFAHQLLSAVFFLSGAAALLFETLWFRQAGLTLGNGVWASSLVLSSFMAGLALGNALAARFGDRVAHPARCFAGLELAIAASGVGLVWLLPALTPWLAPLLGPLLDEPWLVNPLRLAIGFALLLAPATAMGATLPILVKALVRRDADFGPALGRLYGCNTLGAVAGALAGELVLIGWLGVSGTAWVAGALDVLAALGALGVWRRAGASTRPAATATRRAATPERRAAARLLGAAFGCGACMLALEVVGFRFLLLYVDPGRISFAVMLAVVLAGIGLGSLAAGAWLRRRPGVACRAAPLALACGAAVVASYAGFRFAVEPFGSGTLLEVRHIALVAAALLGPAALGSGLLFPLIGASLRRQVPSETRATGWLTLANTLGAALGSLLGGFVLLPGIGMERSLFGVALGYGGVALLLRGGAAREPAPRLARRLGWAAAGVYALAVLAFPHGLMERRYLRTIVERLDLGGQLERVATREGSSETILYLRQDYLGEPHSYRMVTNGFSMSDTAVQAKRYMKLYVYLPEILRGELRDALLISYGVGSTARALVDTRSLEHIDVVDISKEILEMSAIVYPDPDEHPLRDPRVEVHVEDGRYFLETTQRRYDLITGEPPPPKAAGVVNLYTREYFALIRERLREGGVNTYWLPAHALTPSDARAIVRAYCDVFEDCSLWAGAGLDWMLVGSRGGAWHRDAERFAKPWRDPRVGPELRALGFERPEQIGALFMADASDLAALTADTQPLVDDFPKRLSRQSLPRDEAEAAFAAWMNTASARRRFPHSDFVQSAWPPEWIEPTLPYFEFQALINQLGFQTRPARGPQEPALHALLTRTPLETLVLWTLRVHHDSLRILDRHLERGGDPRPHLGVLASRALARRDYARAEELFGEASRWQPGQPDLVYLRIFSLCMDGRIGEAEQLAAGSLPAMPEGAEQSPYWRWMGETFGLRLPRAGLQLGSLRP